MEQTDTNKRAAQDFLEMVIAGKIDDAYEKYVDMSGKQHNVSTPAGFEELRAGMKGAEGKFPNKQFTIQHVLGDGDMVMIHSHLVLEEKTLDFSAVHIFHFKDGKIIEFWDVAQTIPTEVINSDGAF